MLFAFHARCLNLEHWDAVAVDVIVVVVAAVDWNEHHLPIEHVRSTWWLRNNLIHSEAISWSECSSDRNIRVLLYFGVGLFSRFRALQEHAYETCMLRYICTLDHIIRSGTSFCVGPSLSLALSLSLFLSAMALFVYYCISPLILIFERCKWLNWPKSLMNWVLNTNNRMNYERMYNKFAGELLSLIDWFCNANS